MDRTEMLGSLLGAALSASPSAADPGFKAATAADIAELIEATHQAKFKFGDIVQLRDFAKNRYKWPKDGDQCIVTQILEAPHRCAYDGSAASSIRHDIALAFIDPDGDIMEFLHDSRNFRKVGTIYDVKLGVDKNAH